MSRYLHQESSTAITFHTTDSHNDECNEIVSKFSALSISSIETRGELVELLVKQMGSVTVETKSSQVLYTAYSEFQFYLTPQCPHMLARGINFQVKCNNNQCTKFGEYPIVHLGMCGESNQICHYAEYMYELACPVCKSHISPMEIYNIIFSDCAVKVKCRRSDSSRIVEFSGVARDNESLWLKVVQDMNEKYDYFKFSLS